MSKTEREIKSEALRQEQTPGESLKQSSGQRDCPRWEGRNQHQKDPQRLRSTVDGSPMGEQLREGKMRVCTTAITETHLNIDKLFKRQRTMFDRLD